MANITYMRTNALTDNNNKIQKYLAGESNLMTLSKTQMVQGDLDGTPCLIIALCPRDSSVTKYMSFFVTVRNRVVVSKTNTSSYDTVVASVYAEWCPSPKNLGTKVALSANINGRDRSISLKVNRKQLEDFAKATKNDAAFIGTEVDGRVKSKTHVIKVLVPIAGEPVELAQGYKGVMIDHHVLTQCAPQGPSIKVHPKLYGMMTAVLMGIFNINLSEIQANKHFAKKLESVKSSYTGSTGKFKPKLVVDILGRKVLAIKDGDTSTSGSSDQIVPFKGTLSPQAHNELMLWYFNQGNPPNKRFRPLISRSAKARNRHKFAVTVPALLAYFAHGNLDVVNTMKAQDKIDLLKKSLAIGVDGSGKPHAEHSVLEKLGISEHVHNAFHVQAVHDNIKAITNASAPGNGSKAGSKQGNSKNSGSSKKSKSTPQANTVVVIHNKGLKRLHSAHVSGMPAAIQAADAAASSIAVDPDATDLEAGKAHMMRTLDNAKQAIADVSDQIENDKGLEHMSNKGRLRFYAGLTTLLQYIVTFFMAALVNFKKAAAVYVGTTLYNSTNGLGFINTGSNSNLGVDVSELSYSPSAFRSVPNTQAFGGDGFINTGSNVGDKDSVDKPDRSLTSQTNYASGFSGGHVWDDLPRIGADYYTSGIFHPPLKRRLQDNNALWDASQASSTLSDQQLEYWNLMGLTDIVLNSGSYSWPVDDSNVPYGRDHLTDTSDGNEICYRALAPVSEADESCCKPSTDIFMDVPGGSVITSCTCSALEQRIADGDDVPYPDRCLPDNHVGPTLCCMSLVDTLSYRSNDEYHDSTMQLQQQINGHTSVIMNQINDHVFTTNGDITALEASYDDLDSGLLNLSSSIVLYVDVVAATKLSVNSFNQTIDDLSRQLGVSSSNHSETTENLLELSDSLDEFVFGQSNVDSVQDLTITSQAGIIASQGATIGVMNDTINALTETVDLIKAWLGTDGTTGDLRYAIELEILSPHLTEAIDRRLNEAMAQFVTPSSYVVSWECGGTDQPECSGSADSTYTWESTCEDSTWESISVHVEPNDDNTCPDTTSSGIDIGCTPTQSGVDCSTCYTFGNSSCDTDDSIPGNVWVETMLANGLDSVTNDHCKCFAFCSNTTADSECDLSRTRYDYGYRGTKVNANVTSGVRRVSVEFSQDNGKYTVGDNSTLGMWVTSDYVTRCKTHDNTTCYYNKECAISYTELTGNLPLTCWSNEHPNVFTTEVDTPRASVRRSIAQFDTTAPIGSYKTSAQVALIAIVVVLSLVLIAGCVIMYIYFCKRNNDVHSKSELKAMTHQQLLDHCSKLGVSCDKSLADSVLISMIQECERSTERYANGKEKNMSCLNGARVIASRARNLARKAYRKCTSKLKEMSDEDSKLMGSVGECSMTNHVEYRELLANRGADFVAQCILNAGGSDGKSLPMPIKQYLIEGLALNTSNPIRDVEPWLSPDTIEGKNYRDRIKGSNANSKYMSLYMIPSNTKVPSLKRKGALLGSNVEVSVGNSTIKCNRITYLPHSSDGNGMTLPREYGRSKDIAQSAPAKLRVPKTGGGSKQGIVSVTAGNNTLRSVSFIWRLVAVLVAQIKYTKACDGSFAINSIFDVANTGSGVGISKMSTLLTIPSSGQCMYAANTTINVDGVTQNVGVNFLIETRSVGVTTAFDEEFVTANYQVNYGTIFSCGFALESNNAARDDFCEVSSGGARCTNGTGLIDYSDVSKLIKTNGLSNNVNEYGAFTEGTYVCKGVNALSTQSPSYCVFGGCSELIGVVSPTSTDLDASRASANMASGPESSSVYTSYVMEVVESGQVLMNITCPISTSTTTCVDLLTNNTIVVTPQSFPDYSSSITDNSDYRWHVREDYADGDTDKIRYGPWASTTTCNQVPDIKAGSWEGVWDSSQNELGSCMDVTTFNYDAGSGEYTIPTVTPMWSRIWDGSDASYQKTPVQMGDWNCYASNLERTCTTTDNTQSFMATIELPQMSIDWTAVQESGDFTISNCTIDGYSLSSANSSRIDCDCDGQGSARIIAVDGDESFTEVTDVKLSRNTAECSDDKVKILFTAGEGNVNFWLQLQDQGRTSRSTRNTWTHVNGYLNNDMIDTNTSISNWTTTGINIDGQHSSSNDFLEILIASICGAVILVVIVVVVYCYCRPEAQMKNKALHWTADGGVRQMNSMQNSQLMMTSRAFDGTMYRGGSSNDPSKNQ